MRGIHRKGQDPNASLGVLFGRLGSLVGPGVVNERNTPLLILFSLFHFLSRRLDIKDVLYHIITAYPNAIRTAHVHVLTRDSTAYVYIDF